MGCVWFVQAWLVLQARGMLLCCLPPGLLASAHLKNTSPPFPCSALPPQDAKWAPSDAASRAATGVALGSGMSGCSEVAEAYQLMVGCSLFACHSALVEGRAGVASSEGPISSWWASFVSGGISRQGSLLHVGAGVHTCCMTYLYMHTCRWRAS